MSVKDWAVNTLSHRDNCFVTEQHNDDIWVSQKHCSCGRFDVIHALGVAEEYITQLESFFPETCIIKKSYQAMEWKKLNEEKK